MDDSHAPDDQPAEPSRPRTVFDGFRRPVPSPTDGTEEEPHDEVSQPYEIKSGIIAYEIRPLDEEAAQIGTAVAQEPLSSVEEPSCRSVWRSPWTRRFLLALIVAVPIALVFTANADPSAEAQRTYWLIAILPAAIVLFLIGFLIDFLINFWIDLTWRSPRIGRCLLTLVVAAPIALFFALLAGRNLGEQAFCWLTAILPVAIVLFVIHSLIKFLIKVPGKILNDGWNDYRKGIEKGGK